MFPHSRYTTVYTVQLAIIDEKLFKIYAKKIQMSLFITSKALFCKVKYIFAMTENDSFANLIS